MLPNKSEIIHHWKLGKRKKEFSPKTNVRASSWPNSLTHPRHLTMSRYLPDVPVLHTTSPSPPPPLCPDNRFLISAPEDINSVSTVLFRSSEEDECQPNPCQNGGRCMAHYFGGGFDCECPMGFRGTTCQGQLNFSLPNFNCITFSQ